MHLDTQIVIALEAQGHKVEHHFVLKDHCGLENLGVAEVGSIVEDFKNHSPCLVCLGKLDEFLVSQPEHLLHRLGWRVRFVTRSADLLDKQQEALQG